ncbi:NmrA family NAD(P)-binding protein [uncultured Chryseobacterium sp.]|uniref:NmrA family NAD(P)-binding protein n=1 Tax=uncultured Chryseobacterium sp. TaxID=259322 RepID=UPI002589D746|nr:NmrA family NAD(P)-binding protein [uncultured Chryseobacterium sp.]
MYTVIGASGHVGSIVATELLNKGLSVQAILRNPTKAAQWQEKGAKVALADLLNYDSLATALKDTDTLFVMTPPAFDLEDPIGEHLKMLDNIAAAVQQSSIRKIVYLSSIGGHLRNGTGAILKLYDMEQKLRLLDIPTVGIRAGWFMENFGESIKQAASEGFFYSFINPADLKLPMVAAKDIGHLASLLMQQALQGHRMIELSGPDVYSAEDVASVLSTLFEKQISVKVIPSEQYQSTYRQFGLTDAAAKLMAEMNEGFNNGHIRFENKEGIEQIYGETTLAENMSFTIEKEHMNFRAK